MIQNLHEMKLKNQQTVKDLAKLMRRKKDLKIRNQQDKRKSQILPLPDPEPKFKSEPNPKHEPEPELEPEPNKRTQSYDNVVDNLNQLKDSIIIQQDKLDTIDKKGTQKPQVRSVTKSVQR